MEKKKVVKKTTKKVVNKPTTKKVSKTNTKKKKGFTLIELLAVIIILGILMIIAIPSVTSYISDSRKSAYVDTAKEIISGARNLVNEGKLGMYDTNATYYVPYSCITTENSSKSPYGNFVDEKTYVIVLYNGKGYDYYWMSLDDSGQGIKTPTSIVDLDEDDIESNLTPDDLLYKTLNNKKSLVIFNNDCSHYDTPKVTGSGIIAPVYNCSYDGELVQGAELIDGNYVYRYKQENRGSRNNWANINEDGWGASILEKGTSNAVASKVCTSINGKPIVSMRDMYYYNNATSIDLSVIDTSEVTNMYGMFWDSYYVKSLDLSNFDTSKVTNMDWMFTNCYNLESLDLSGFDTSNVTSASVFLQSNGNLKTVNMDNWDIRKLYSSLGGAFGGTGIETFSAKKWKIPENLTDAFFRSWGANFKTMDVSNWDLSNTVNINGLFSGGRNLERIDGLNTWNVSNIKYMNSLFSGDTKLTSIDLSSWDTSSILGLDALFLGCTNLTEVNMDNWDLSNMSSYLGGGVFSNTPSLKKVSMKNWKLPTSVNNWLFRSWTASTIEEIDLTGWDLSKTTSLYGLLANGTTLKNIKGLNTWDVSHVTNMEQLFYGDSNLTTLDLSSWDMSNVTNTANMFTGCTSLTTAYARTQADANILNASSGKPTNVNFIVKP